MYKVCKDRVKVCKDRVNIVKDSVKVWKDRVKVCKDRIKVCKDRVKVCKDRFKVLKDRVKVCKDRLEVCKDRVKVCISSTHRNIPFRIAACLLSLLNSFKIIHDVFLLKLLLESQSTDSNLSGVDLHVIVGASAGALVLIVIICAVTCLCWRRMSIQKEVNRIE